MSAANTPQTVHHQLDLIKQWFDNHILSKMESVLTSEVSLSSLKQYLPPTSIMLATPPLLLILSSLMNLYGNYRKVSQIPGTVALFFSPFKIPLLAPVFYMGNWEGMIEHAEKHGDGEGNMRVSFAGFNYFMVTRDRALMKEILLTKQSSLDKPGLVYDMFNVFGENIVSALTIESWKRHHKVCNAAFSVENLKYMCGEAVKVTDLLTNIWEERINKSQDGSFQFNCDDFSMVTLEVLGLAGFNISFGVFDKHDESGRQFRDAVEKIFSVGMLMRRFLGGIPIIYTLAQKVFGVSHALDVINKTLDTAIETRRKEMEDIDTFSKSDILSLLVKANSQENLLTDRELKSNSLIFTLAGEETTSTTLQWVVYELAKNPQYQEMVREEIERVLPENRIPSYDDYDNLDLINCIFLETLRLHPAAAAILKQANKNVTIGKYTIPKDTVVECSITAIQKSESVWPEADSFKPERWMDREFRSKAQHDYSFLSFSTGLRKCIGFNFSKMEGCMVLARILKSYRFELLNKESEGDVVYGSNGVTTRPENLKVKVCKIE